MKNINSSTLSLLEKLLKSQAALCQSCSLKYNVYGEQEKGYSSCLKGLLSLNETIQNILKGDENETNNA